jgi:CheY-like chemotaxis protein
MIFTLAKKTTLIVEDFAEFARSVRAMLHSMGATEVDIVYNAEDAIEACKCRKYDVILSDYNLGQRKDGQQLLEELYKYNQLKSNCVFLMLTAENTSAMVMGAVEFRPDGYLAKPFNGNLLKSRLQKATEKKKVLESVNRAMANRQWHTAIEQIELVLPKFPKYKMSCLRSQYRALRELKRYKEALALVTEIISVRAIPWAMEAVGEIYYLTDKTDKAKGVFQNMITEFPVSLEGYDWLAKIQRELGEPLEAQATLLKALEKSPKALKRQKTLGEVAEENNDPMVMTQAYRNAVKYGKNSAFSSPDEYIKLTSGISKLLVQKEGVDNARLINEANETFQNMEKNFISDTPTNIRGNVARANFHGACNEKDKVEEHLDKTQILFDKLEEQLSGNVCLELNASLSLLGRNELADKILDDAIQQNLDDPKFILKASKLSNNSELIEKCKLASQNNLKAISCFEKKNYDGAILLFNDAYKLSPKNINISLNYVQALLKQLQSSGGSTKGIIQAETVLADISNLPPSDTRYARFSELNRLVQLMRQKMDSSHTLR